MMNSAMKCSSSKRTCEDFLSKCWLIVLVLVLVLRSFLHNSSQSNTPSPFTSFLLLLQNSSQSNTPSPFTSFLLLLLLLLRPFRPSTCPNSAIRPKSKAPFALLPLDKNCTAEARTNRNIQNNENFNNKVLWTWILVALVHSIVLYWLPMPAYGEGVIWGSGKSGDLLGFQKQEV
jgi:hypothetical protein